MRPWRNARAMNSSVGDRGLRRPCYSGNHITTVMETIDPQVAAGLTDANVIELWLHRQPSPLTRSVYERDIRPLRTWTGKGMGQTSGLDLESFAAALSESGLASISVGRTLAAVRSLFRFAARVGHCSNTAAGIDLPRNERQLSDRILAAEDVRRMIRLERNRPQPGVAFAALRNRAAGIRSVPTPLVGYPGAFGFGTNYGDR